LKESQKVYFQPMPADFDGMNDYTEEDYERDEAVRILAEKAEDSDDPVIKLVCSSGGPLRYEAPPTEQKRETPCTEAQSKCPHCKYSAVGNHSDCPHCKYPDTVRHKEAKMVCETISATQLQWALALNITKDGTIMCSGCRAKTALDIARNECAGCPASKRRADCSCHSIFTVKCCKCSVQLRKRYSAFGVPKSEFIAFIRGAADGCLRAL
jgi:hypothetical protein